MRIINVSKLLLFLILIFIISCTFGSVGDSEKEKLKTLQNLLVLRNNQITSLNTSLEVFDNQADDNLSTIEFTSGGNTYSISMANDSYVQWENGFYRLNPNEKAFGILNIKNDSEKGEDLRDGYVGKTHTPFTVPLDLPATDIYGRSYSFLNPGTETNITNNNSTNETGAAFTSRFTKMISDSPIGVISLATISWEQIYVNVTITRNSISKNVKILLGQGISNIRPKCRIKVESSRTKPVSIGLQYSNLFRDYVENGNSVSFLQNVFSRSGSEIIVTSISNADLLANLNRNLSTEDLVINFPRCTPGVDR